MAKAIQVKTTLPEKLYLELKNKADRFGLGVGSYIRHLALNDVQNGTDSEKVHKLREFISKKPFLTWDTKNYEGLSKEAIIERVLMYGDWKEFKEVEKTLGRQEFVEIFTKLASKKRVNLKPETINLFSKYLQQYA